MDEKRERQRKRDNVTGKVVKILRSIVLCRSRGFIESSFILFYSLIDILASLDRELSHIKVMKSDFINWVNKYILHGNKFEFTALELYAARCGIVHQLSTDSDLSRAGVVRRISYAWGKGDSELLKTAMQNEKDAVVVHFDDLLVAFNQGVEKFWESCPIFSDREKLILDRAKETIASIESWQLKAYIQKKGLKKSKT